MSGLIAIVGRPNVGKSAIFNRLVGKRIAIVHDEPGVTRDRISAEAEWRGRPFTVVDTGGIGLLRGEKGGDPLVLATIQQVQIAIEAADVIFFVVNVQEGLVALDREVATRLRLSGKPIFLVANKADTERHDAGAVDFAELGLDRVFAISAIHGRGVESLLDTAITLLPASPVQDSQSDLPTESPVPVTKSDPGGPLKLAIVGRPNVGKSSIINALTRSERVIVTPIPGTTRDSIDVPFEIETEGVRQKYILIDTAGLRKERRVDDSIEFYSVKRTEESIGRCDIVIFVLDAETGIMEQDKKIADKIVAANKACLVVLNKWDLAAGEAAEVREKEQRRQEKKSARRYDPDRPLTTLAEFAQWIQEQLFFLSYAPVIFTSAKSGFHLDRLLEAVRYVAAQLQQSIPTALLNRTLRGAIEKRQPVSAQGHQLTFYYATQVEKAPPTFLLFVNRDELFSTSYAKYLAGQLRRAFGYEGCPILLVPKARPKTIEPVRRRQTNKRAQRH